MPNPVNYIVTNTPVSVNAGETWVNQDIGNSIIESGLNIQGAPTGDVLKMTISPANTATHTVSAINFSIAGETYSSSTEVTSEINGQVYSNYFWYLDTDMLDDALPNGVSSVVMYDTGVPGSTTNTVEVIAFIIPDTVMPSSSAILQLDIDGDADQIINETSSAFYAAFSVSPPVASEGDIVELSLQFVGTNSNNGVLGGAILPTINTSVTPLISDTTTITGSDISAFSTDPNQAGCGVGPVGIEYGTDIYTSWVNDAGSLISSTQIPTFNFSVDQNTIVASDSVFYQVCMDDLEEGTETLTFKLPQQDSTGINTGELEATLTIQPPVTPDPVPGCTDPNADNYSQYATSNDGSCIYSGCTDSTMLNYNPLATIDDGSCMATPSNIEIVVQVGSNSNLNVTTVTPYASCMPYPIRAHNGFQNNIVTFSTFEVGDITDTSASLIVSIPAEGTFNNPWENQFSGGNQGGIADAIGAIMNTSFIIKPKPGYTLSRHNIRLEPQFNIIPGEFGVDTYSIDQNNAAYPNIPGIKNPINRNTASYPQLDSVVDLGDQLNSIEDWNPCVNQLANGKCIEWTYQVDYPLLLNNGTYGWWKGCNYSKYYTDYNYCGEGVEEGFVFVDNGITVQTHFKYAFGITDIYTNETSTSIQHSSSFGRYFEGAALENLRKLYGEDNTVYASLEGVQGNVPLIDMLDGSQITTTSTPLNPPGIDNFPMATEIDWFQSPVSDSNVYNFESVFFVDSLRDEAHDGPLPTIDPSTDAGIAQVNELIAAGEGSALTSFSANDFENNEVHLILRNTLQWLNGLDVLNVTALSQLQSLQVNKIIFTIEGEAMPIEASDDGNEDFNCEIDC